MDYQAERLGLIVDLAEQSMDIVQRFSNDPVDAGNIQTASGPIKNLKQVSADIKSDGQASIDVAVTDLMDTLKAETSVSALIDGLTNTAVLAEESANRARLAADAANATGKVYATPAAGLAATTNGLYFSVPSADSNEYLILYKNNVGAALKVSTYPSAAIVQAAVNGIRLLFTDRITVNPVDRSVTYPAGIAMRSGETFQAFEKTTISGVEAGRAQYHWFNFNALLTAPQTSPFMTADGGSPIPTPQPGYLFLGTYYRGVYTSYFPFEYKGAPRVFNRLPSIIPNGGFRDLGAGNVLFGDVYPDTTFTAPVAAITDVALNDLGCYAGFKLSAADAANTGGFVVVDTSSIGHDDGLKFFASLLVHSADGTWNFGGGVVGPIVRKVLSNGGGSGNTVITSYTELSPNLRNYYLSFTGPIGGPGNYLKELRLGLAVSVPRTNTFTATGFWLSASSQSYRPFETDGEFAYVQIQDTQWPDWASGALSDISAFRMQASIQLHESRLTKLESPPASVSKGLKKLAAALANPLYSVLIRFIGDSITWGMTATGNGPLDPRTHALSDTRNNLTAPTWVNLFRQYLGKTYCDGAVTENAPGSGFYKKTHTLDPLNGDKRFRYFYASTGKAVPASYVLPIDTRSGPFFGRCLDAGLKNLRLEFDLVGDNLSIVYASQNAADPAAAIAQIVNADTGEVLGSFNYYAAAAQWGQVASFTFPYGKYRIQLRDTAPVKSLRLEAIRVTRKIQVANDGLIGTNTAEWLPTGPILPASIQDSDGFVFCMLGTNDRAMTTVPNDPIRTMDNLRKITKYVRDTRGKEVILMAANAVADVQEYPADITRKYSQGDVARVTKDLAAELELDFIDHYEATMQMKIDGVSYLADGLHPNDAGHRAIFENKKARLLRAGTV